MIRLFTFKNNFLSDNVRSVAADYNVFGYFDGLIMKCVENEREALRMINDPMRMEFLSQKVPEQCDYYNIIGMCLEKSDEEFWKMGGNPFIFISCLRFLKRLDEPEKFISQIKKRYEELENLCIIGYTTLDSSNLIICIRTSKYSLGDEIIENYANIICEEYPDNQLQKGFSTAVVHQAVLDIYGIFDCRYAMSSVMWFQVLRFEIENKERRTQVRS